MPFGFNFSKNKNKTSFNNQTTNTIAPWLTNEIQGGLSQFRNLTGNIPGLSWPTAQPSNQTAPQMWAPSGDYTDPNYYLGNIQPNVVQPGTAPAGPTGPTSFIPEFSDDTNAAFGAARGYTGNAPQLLALANRGPHLLGDAAQVQAANVGPIADVNAGTIASQDVNARRGSEFRSDYFDPYINDVVNTSLADFDTGVDRSANAMRASRDAGSAFGSRSRNADAIFQGDAARGRGALSAGLRSNAFNTATGYGMQDANRFLSADTTNAGNRLSASTSNVANRLAAALANQNTALNVGTTNAGLLDSSNRFNAGAANAFSLADQGSRNANDTLSFNALNAAGNADLNRTNLLAGVGSAQDERNYAVRNEPLDLLLKYFGLLGNVPYDTSGTESGTGKSSGTSVGGSYKSG